MVPFFDDMMMQAMINWIGKLDVVLLGRKTYEMRLLAYVGDDPIEQLNSVRKHVVSRTLSSVGWNNSTLIKGDVVEGIKRDDPGSAGDRGAGCSRAVPCLRGSSSWKPEPRAPESCCMSTNRREAWYGSFEFVIRQRWNSNNSRKSKLAIRWRS